MSMPVLPLPVLQNWDCHACGNCCRQYDVPVTEAERQRIVAQGWQQDPEVGDLPLLVRQGRWSRSYRLFRGDRGCVFLSRDNRCRLHERFGPEAKPLACRLFPLVLVPAGDHWRVGLRFGCPSAANNQGRPLSEHVNDAQQLALLLERRDHLDTLPRPPAELQRGQIVSWPDLLLLVNALQKLLGQPGERLERRWRKCLALAALCRQARFDAVTGTRLEEFLQVVTKGLETDVPANPRMLPAPGWVGRMCFRQILAILLRRDRGDLRGSVADSGWGRMLTTWRFARGTGTIPPLNALMPDATFASIEATPTPRSAESEAILERYYLVKVASLQFWGPTSFGLPLWDGLEALAITLPAIFWLMRTLAGRSAKEAATLAIQIVDDHVGCDSVLGSRRFRWMVSTLARRGEIAGLIERYAG